MEACPDTVAPDVDIDTWTHYTTRKRGGTMILKADQLHKAHGITVVLDDISFALERGQKAGLVGDNGTGKSTLLKILAGLVEPDGGEVVMQRGLVVGYMPQDTSLVSDETIGEYLRRVSGIAELESAMGASDEALEEYERREGYAFDHRMESMLAGFGLGKLGSSRSIKALSSGQKSKVFMAGVLLRDADLLLLDEPTNNLDLPALIWLERFLSRVSAACIIVSHDRFFLDRVVRKIFEIDWATRTLNITNGKYSDYLERARKERVRQLQAYEAQQDEIERLNAAARAKRAAAERGSKFKGKDNDKFLRGFKQDRAAGSGRAAKNLEKRIEQMDRLERPLDREALRIHLKPERPGGSRDITLTDVTAGYAGDEPVVGPVSLFIPYGSRVVILGLNGSGKSTLLKTVAGELEPLSGKVEIGSALTVGNLMQEHDNLPREATIRTILTERGGLLTEEAYALATKYGFASAEIDKEIGKLSPGGRARLLLALFSARSVNVLLLDEPTNHLDISATDALEEAVTHYEGTVVLVSHDRYFLEKFDPTDTYVLAGGQLSRQQSYAAYLAEAERIADRLSERV